MNKLDDEFRLLRTVTMEHDATGKHLVDFYIGPSSQKITVCARELWQFFDPGASRGRPKKITLEIGAVSCDAVGSYSTAKHVVGITRFIFDSGAGTGNRLFVLTKDGSIAGIEITPSFAALLVRAWSQAHQIREQFLDKGEYEQSRRYAQLALRLWIHSE